MHARKECNGRCIRCVEFENILYLNLPLTFTVSAILPDSKCTCRSCKVVFTPHSTNEVAATAKSGEKDALIASLREQIKLLNEQVHALTKQRDELKLKVEAAQIDLIEQERRSKALKEMADKYEKDLEARVRKSVDEGKE